MKSNMSASTGWILVKLKPLTESDLQWKTTSKYEKWNITATTGLILLKFETKDIGIKPECTKVSN